MAIFGTTNEGKDNIIAAQVYDSSLEMGLYTNTPNSLTTESVLADITEPSGTGYARVTLDQAWSSSNGVVTYTPNVEFENTGGTSWTGDVTGAFITDGTYLLHFKDRTGGAVEMTAGKVLEVSVSALLS